MSDDAALDLHRLQRSCAQCSLQQLCLPAGIDAHDVERLDSVVRRRRPLGQGEHLFRAGTALTALYVSREGAFKTVATSEDGEEQILGFHLPGELLGLDALGNERHRCDAVALGAASVCEVPIEDLERVARQVPGLQRQLMRVIGRSFGRDMDHFEMLSRRQAQERVALFLHGLSERFRSLGYSGEEFLLPMSRSDIGRYLGLVIETVSRSFGKLQDDGYIAVRGRRIRIIDIARLDALAHPGR